MDSKDVYSTLSLKNYLQCVRERERDVSVKTPIHIVVHLLHWPRERRVCVCVCVCACVFGCGLVCVYARSTAAGSWPARAASESRRGSAPTWSSPGRSSQACWAWTAQQRGHLLGWGVCAWGWAGVLVGTCGGRKVFASRHKKWIARRRAFGDTDLEIQKNKGIER